MGWRVPLYSELEHDDLGPSADPKCGIGKTVSRALKLQNMDPEEHFPSDYRTARTAFLKACQAAGLSTLARVHPKAAGRDGKPLFLDTATVGERKAQTALLLISGTHGVEGYFGSAVQTGLLRQGLSAPKYAKIVLLHALNPYGFSWDRRVNEDNADVNRNFVDHSAPPTNTAYAALADFIAPKDISRDAMKAANAKLRAYSEAHGAFALQEAISKGQYAYPDGLYFGGRRKSWSAEMVDDVLREELASVQRLVVIDFHTGLGAHGEGEMISEDLPGSAPYLRAKKMWGSRVKSSQAGEIGLSTTHRHHRQGGRDTDGKRRVDLRRFGGGNFAHPRSLQRAAQRQLAAPNCRRRR